MSSVIVDISKASAATIRDMGKRSPSVPQTAPIGGGPKQLRPALQHQASLTASATAAVGEAGKFLAHKLANTEANLRGARDIVMAAANHFTGGAVPDSRIKFKNLHVDEEEEEDYDDDDDNDRRQRAAVEAAGSDEEEEDDDETDYANRNKRVKRNRRSQSVLSAALNSYKHKQRGGYQMAMDEDDEEEEEDDDDEKMNLNRSASFKNKTKSKEFQASEATSSSTDDKHTPTHHGSSMPLTRSKISSSRRAQNRSKRARKLPVGSMERGGGASGKPKYEEEEDTESGTTYRCLDNSVALLMKTRLEETILRIAVGAILFVAVGIFILLSLPPTPPPKEITDILLKT